MAGELRLQIQVSLKPPIPVLTTTVTRTLDLL
jgi:hypothetical protein